MNERTVFLISDQTGVTVETMGHSLLTQFDAVKFKTVTVPFVDTVDKAKELVVRIDRVADKEGRRPIVFTSLVQEEIREQLSKCRGLVLDFFQPFVAPLEAELAQPFAHTPGRAHGMLDVRSYDQRIAATNYVLAADDGHGLSYYDQADVILMGVSRSGKTPTCLYLALQYGVSAANYPLAEEDLEATQLPQALIPYREKLYGLTISPERLRQIRHERRSSGRYASAQQVNFEVRASEALFKRYKIPYIDTTHSSVEEIASTILNDTGLERRGRS